MSWNRDYSKGKGKGKVKAIHDSDPWEDHFSKGKAKGKGKGKWNCSGHSHTRQTRRSGMMLEQTRPQKRAVIHHDHQDILTKRATKLQIPIGPSLQLPKYSDTCSSQCSLLKLLKTSAQQKRS